MAWFSGPTKLEKISQVKSAYHYLHAFIESYLQGKNARYMCHNIQDSHRCHLIQGNNYKKVFFCSMIYRMYNFLSASKSVMYRYVCYFQFSGMKSFTSAYSMGLGDTENYVCPKHVKLNYTRYSFSLGPSISCTRFIFMYNIE